MSNYTVSVKFKASTSDFQSKMSAVSKQFQATSAKVGSMGKKFQTVGKGLTNKITKPAMVAGAALAAVPLVKGWKRLVAIDDAKAKLEGLGFSAKKVEGIMDSALTSVKGTSYGLDEAATAAASAVAAGIKPGKELTKYLSTVGDAAAIAGVSMGEMGSVFGKVQTAQRAYTGELNQLADKGVPIFQWLAEEAGVSAEEVRKMASNGEISAEMFYKAIDKNIGGAAKIMGQKSFSGALANIGASIGRIGANFLDASGKGGGFFSQLKPLMASFNESLGVLEDKAKDFGVAFGKAFSQAVEKVEELKSKWDGLSPSVKSLIGKVVLFGSIFAVSIGPVLTLVSKLMTGFAKFAKVAGTFKVFGTAVKASMVAPLGAAATGATGLAASLGAALGPILPYIAAAVALGVALVYLWKTDGDFRASMKKSASTIKGALIPVVDALKEAFKTIAPIIGDLIKFLAVAFAKIIPIIAPVITFLVEKVAKWVVTFAKVVVTIINAITAIVKFFKKAFTAIWEKAKNVVDNIKNAWTALKTALGAIAEWIRTNIVTKFQAVWEKVKVVVDKIKGAWTALKTLLAPIFNWFRDTIGNRFTSAKDKVVAAVNAIRKKWNALKAGLATIVSSIRDGISNKFTSARDKVSGVVNSIKTKWSGLKSGMATITSSIRDGISSKFSSAKTKARSALNSIKTKWSAVKTAMAVVSESIRSTIARKFKSAKTRAVELLDAIKSAWEKAKGYGGGLVQKAKGLGAKIKGAFLARGTDDWQGGFARINEGGRGELVNLPSGTQVIPHDISMKYAKESARVSSQSNGQIDYGRLINGIAEAMSGVTVEHSTTLDGKTVAKGLAPLIDRQNGRRAVLAGMGV